MGKDTVGAVSASPIRTRTARTATASVLVVPGRPPADDQGVGVAPGDLDPFGFTWSRARNLSVQFDDQIVILLLGAALAVVSGRFLELDAFEYVGGWGLARLRGPCEGRVIVHGL